MNRLALIFGAILIIVILCLAAGTMAQDPNDPGEPDTLYFSPGGMHSPTGDTLYVCPDLFPQDVTVYLNFWNDNPLAAFVTPFVDNCDGPPCDAYLDLSKNKGLEEFPKCFEGSRVANFPSLVGKFKYSPPNFYLNGVAFLEPPVPPGDGLLATLIFTVNDTGRICLDTCFWPPSSVLTFVDTQVVGYAPVFEKKTFMISNCTYTPADPNYDGKTDIVDAVYLVNYIFRGGPPPCVEKSGDVSCDDEVTVVDIVYLIGYLFRGGPPPGYCP